MLRFGVLLLALANVVFFVWTLGWLDDLIGTRSQGDREPQRLARQLNSESVRILPPGSIKAPAPAKAPEPSPGPPPTAPTAPPPSGTAPAGSASASGTVVAENLPGCLEAGPFNAAQIGPALAVLQANLPEGSWTQVKNEKPALWMVYIGKINDGASMSKRQEELRRLKVEFDELRAPSELAPGISLGRFEVRANANNLLDQLAKRGVRNARVIESSPVSSSYMLRVDKPSAALAERIEGLPQTVLGKGFVPCARP